MNVLVIATLYPNESQPVHAVFVEQRVVAMARRFPVRVLCPVPWFPFTGWMGRYRHRASIPRREVRHGIPVEYPRFLSVPKFLKPLDGVFLGLACRAATRRIAREFPVDRIDAHLAFPDGFGAVWLGRRLGVPVSVTLRGHDVNDLPDYPVRRRQVAWTLRHADAVFAVADALRDAAVELGAPPERTRTVANGVDPERFSPRDRREARRELGLPEDGRVVLSVGHLVERKGFHHVVRALPRVLRDAPDARLVIVGAPGEEGDFTAGVETAIRETGLEDRVRLVGAVRNEELAPWYSAADLFVLASAKEGRPNVVLEALACGTPVVATRVWGTPELVSRPEVGRLVDRVDPETLGEALAWGLTRPWNRDVIASHAGSFSWESAAEIVERELRSFGAKGERA
ncbi:MAG: glycosyltransferase [Gemmatimonadetes bacterium]|nr:glycosyltransferase [Gemmatimonadota bacterium]